MNLAFILSIIISYALALVAMAFYTLLERKYLGYFQLRKGPNKVGLMGLPQPFADAIKLFMKERGMPNLANQTPFFIAPSLGLILALMMWTIYPHSNVAFFLPFGILYFLCVSSMNVYSTFSAGWTSNSKYALLGALRGVAQTISYEVSMSLILISSLLMTMTMDMSSMTSELRSWTLMLMFPLSVIWFITNLAETNRTPFDFAEGESELVSGFNVEYSGGLFALIFMAEYTNILAMSLFSSVIFMSIFFKLNMILVLQTTVIASVFILIRATMPRMRYDHLMSLTWKSFLPFALAAITIITPTMSLFL